MFAISLLSVVSVVLSANSFSVNIIYFCGNITSIHFSCKVENHSEKIVYWIKEHDTVSEIIASKTLSTGELYALEPRYNIKKNFSLNIYDPIDGEEFRCYVDDDVSGGTTVKLVTYKEPNKFGVHGCDTYPCNIAFDRAYNEGMTCGSSGHFPNNSVYVTWPQLASKDLIELHHSKKEYDIQKSVKVRKFTSPEVICVIEGEALCGKPKIFKVKLDEDENSYNDKKLVFSVIVSTVIGFIGCYIGRPYNI